MWVWNITIDLQCPSWKQVKSEESAILTLLENSGLNSQAIPASRTVSLFSQGYPGLGELMTAISCEYPFYAHAQSCTFERARMGEVGKMADCAFAAS